jgi:hypothetical protein
MWGWDLDNLVLLRGQLQIMVLATQTVRLCCHSFSCNGYIKCKMLLVKGECVKAEFKTRFKYSGALVQKFHCSFWKCCYTNWTYHCHNCRTVRPAIVITQFRINIPNWGHLLSWGKTENESHPPSYSEIYSNLRIAGKYSTQIDMLLF